MCPLKQPWQNESRHVQLNLALCLAVAQGACRELQPLVSAAVPPRPLPTMVCLATNMVLAVLCLTARVEVTLHLLCAACWQAWHLHWFYAGCAKLLHPSLHVGCCNQATVILLNANDLLDAHCTTGRSHVYVTDVHATPAIHFANAALW